MKARGPTKVAGVVGWPVAHSLSPLIHNAWIKAVELDAVYHAYAVEPEDNRFEGLVRRLIDEGCVGLNITAPFKERALKISEDYGGDVRELGNANLLKLERFEDFDLLVAHNTDPAGLLSALAREQADRGLANRRVLVLGAGAVARTAAVTLTSAAAEVIIVNRTFERARKLAQLLGTSAAPWSELGDHIGRADILINATSAVHEGQALNLDLSRADLDLTVVEMSYRPLRTPLLRQAEALGLRTVDGLAMLIGQARPSFEIFFGTAPPPAEVVDVRALCLRELEAMG